MSRKQVANKDAKAKTGELDPAVSYRMSKDVLKVIDQLIEMGLYKTRSDATRAIVDALFHIAKLAHEDAGQLVFTLSHLSSWLRDPLELLLYLNFRDTLRKASPEKKLTYARVATPDLLEMVQQLDVSASRSLPSDEPAFVQAILKTLGAFHVVAPKTLDANKEYRSPAAFRKKFNELNKEYPDATYTVHFVPTQVELSGDNTLFTTLTSTEITRLFNLNVLITGAEMGGPYLGSPFSALSSKFARSLMNKYVEGTQYGVDWLAHNLIFFMELSEAGQDIGVGDHTPLYTARIRMVTGERIADVHLFREHFMAWVIPLLRDLDATILGRVCEAVISKLEIFQKTGVESRSNESAATQEPCEIQDDQVLKISEKKIG